MHKDEVAALNRDFDYALAKIADLEERVKEFERPTVLSRANTRLRVLSK